MSRRPPERTSAQQKEHERRVAKMSQKAQRESIVWLREHHPDSVTLKTIAAYPGEFRGPAYGKRS